MDKETEIVEYLKKTYSPISILLHGSRAVGKNRPNSDWDIIMIFDQEIPRKGHREEIAGEDVEWRAFGFSSLQENIIDTFDVYLQFAKVLWEVNHTGSEILKKAKDEYNKGPNLSPDQIKREKQFFYHKILGMKDDKETPYMFLRHLSTIFNRASNMWFEILHNEFAKPYYIAIPIIQEEDPEYYENLMNLCGNVSNEEKILSAEWIFNKLYNS